MNRKIAVTYSDLRDGHLEKIKAGAPSFDVLAGDEAKNRISECEIVFGYIQSDKLRELKNLKWFHAQSAGVDHYIKPETGLPDSVILTNSAGMHGISISEHMIGHTLMLMRRLHSYVLQQAQHKWEYLGSVQSIYNSLITVVGMGGIGSQYAMRCHALGAKVRGVVRTPRAEMPNYVDSLYTVDQLDEAIAEADVVALTLPNTAETTQLFNKKRLLKMKKGAIILNVGRGNAIDQDSLIELLESGYLGGAGLDVTEPEPLLTSSKLWDLPNVVLTPHVSGGGSLSLTTDMIVGRFIEYLHDYVADRTFKQVVDRKAGY